MPQYYDILNNVTRLAELKSIKVTVREIISALNQFNDPNYTEEVHNKITNTLRSELLDPIAKEERKRFTALERALSTKIEAFNIQNAEQATLLPPDKQKLLTSILERQITTSTNNNLETDTAQTRTDEIGNLFELINDADSIILWKD